MRVLLALSLLFVPAAASAEWREAETDHFLIVGNKSEGQLRDFAEKLETVHYLMLKIQDQETVEAPYKVRIYIYGTNKDMEAFVGSKDVAGFYRPLTSGPMAVVPVSSNFGEGLSAETILFHEYAHHFMLQYQPAAYPSWYTEGWAELIGTSSFERDGIVTFGKPNTSRSYSLLSGDWIDVGNMVSMPRSELGDHRGHNFYAEAWLLTHYLTVSGERPGQLRKYLNAINSGATIEEAAKAFGKLDKLDDEVQRYRDRKSIDYRGLPIPEDLVADIRFRTLSEAERELVYDKIMFSKPMSADGARAFLMELRLKTGRFPNDPYALQLLAEAEHDLGNYDEARNAAQKILSIDPGNVRTMWLMGRIALDESSDNGDRSAAASTAREWFAKANQAAPKDPLPLIGYFDSYAAEGQTNELALNGLFDAMYSVPQDSDLRMKLATALLSEGGEQSKLEAAYVLRPLAYSPHSPSLAQKARAMIDFAEGRTDSIVTPDEDEDEEDEDEG